MSEDINFLLKNSRPVDYVVYVDSSQRDVSVHLTPAQYSITFAQPFRYVTTVEVIDMIIPATMQKFNSTNNNLRLDPDYRTDRGFQGVDVTIDAGDYLDGDVFVAAVNAKLVGGLQASLGTDGNLSLDGPTPFAVDLGSSMTEALGGAMRERLFDAPISPGFAGSSVSSREMTDVAIGTGTAASNRTMVVCSSVAQSFVAPSTPCNLHELRLPGGKPTLTGKKIGFSLHEDGGGCPGRALEWQAAVPYGGSTITFDTDPFRTGLLNPGDTYWVVARNESSSMASTIVTVPLPIDSASRVLSRTRDREWVADDQVALSLGADVELTPGDQVTLGAGRGFIASLVFSVPVHSLRFPGRLDLFGSRCIRLRCKEVEERLIGSFAYGDNAPGMALIKLVGGTTGTFSQLSNDFYSLKNREFGSPMLSLATMSFRFEMLSNELYDFRGVNHTLVIMVRCLSMHSPGMADFKPVLNPRYTADMVAYANAQWRVRDNDAREFRPRK
jgi:hypothetical protein